MNQEQFGTQPIKKLFVKVAIPSVITMLFASIHIVVDGIFMGKYIGSDALAAVNLIMPFMMILFALADLVASGSSVRIGVLFGEKKDADASRIFSASVLFIFVFTLLMSFSLLFFSKPMIFALIKDENLAQMAYDYAKVFIPFIPLIIPLFAFDNYLLACGKQKQSMWINIGVSILNIILNAWFITYLRLGIEYAALSTAISMMMGTVLCVLPFIMKRLSLKFVKPVITFSELKMIVYNGSSSFFGSIAFSTMAIVTNAFLLHLGGAVAVAALAIVVYIEAMLMPVLMGVVNSVQPAVSYNYGAKKNRRVILIYKLVSLVSFLIVIVAVFVMFLIPEQLVSLFAKENDAEIQQLAKVAILIYAPQYLFVWFSIVSSSFLTALEKPAQSMIIMMLDSVVFPLILMVILSMVMGVKGIFLAQTIGAFLTSIVAFILWRNVEKQLRKV